MAEFKDKVIYQIYPKSFQDTNGDGIVDYQYTTVEMDTNGDGIIDYTTVAEDFDPRVTRTWSIRWPVHLCGSNPLTVPVAAMRMGAASKESVRNPVFTSSR